jgi:hypothetical protein
VLLLTIKLLNQEFLLVKLKSSLRKFYGCHHDLVDRYRISVSQICSICRKHKSVLSSFMTYHHRVNQINTTGATTGTGTAYSSGASLFTPCFKWGSWIMVITKLPNSEQSYKGKVKTHKYIDRQNQSTTGKLWKPLWPWLGTGISNEMVGWIRFETQSLVSCVAFVDRPFFFWPLCCLSFFDLRILITSLVSSNSSLLNSFLLCCGLLYLLCCCGLLFF